VDDLVVRGGDVLDGSGAAPVRADLAIRDGRIVQIAPGYAGTARREIDALAQQLSELDREVVGLRTMLHFLEGSDEAHPQGS